MKDLWKKMLWVLPMLFFVACGGGSGSTAENPNVKEVTVAINLPNNVGSKFNGLSSKRTNVFQKVSIITNMTIDVIDKDGNKVYNTYKMRYHGTRWTVTLLLDTTKAPFTFTVKGYEADGTLRYQGTRSNVQAGDLSKNVTISVNRIYNDGEAGILPTLLNIKVAKVASGNLNLTFKIKNPTKEVVEYNLTTPTLPASCTPLFSPQHDSVSFTNGQTTSSFDVLYRLDSNESCRENNHLLKLTNVVTKNSATIAFSLADSGAGGVVINFPPQVVSFNVAKEASSLTFSVDATDDGGSLFYKWSNVDGNLTINSTQDDAPTWNVTHKDGNSFKIHLLLKDDANATSNYYYKIQGESSTVTINNYTPVKKTGQRKSYDENGTEVTDGSVKDDGYYQKGVINFVRDDEHDIVIDNITGLMWQDNLDAETKKLPIVDGGYWRNKRLTETGDIWGCDSIRPDCGVDTLKGDTADAYCKALRLGGFEDWRLPTREELRGIVYYGNPYAPPTIHSKFKHTARAKYLTSETTESARTQQTLDYSHIQFGTSEMYHRLVNFSDGTSLRGGGDAGSYVNPVKDGSVLDSFNFRCVRDAK